MSMNTLGSTLVQLNLTSLLKDQKPPLQSSNQDSNGAFDEAYFVFNPLDLECASVDLPWAAVDEEWAFSD